MKKVVVVTDMSAKSRAGVRFAIQMAEAGDVELTFLMVYEVLEAAIWTPEEYTFFIQESRKKMLAQLAPFIKSVYRSMKIASAHYHLAVHHDPDTVTGMIDFAMASNADYVCVSSRGAGKVRKMFGSNASDLTARSEIPVLCIPSSYKVKPIKRVLYASDLVNYEAELVSVIDFARPLNAAVEMLHISQAYELIPDRRLMEQSLQQKTGYNKISLHCQSPHIEQTLLKDLSTAIDQSKPSILAVFTHQDRSVFKRVFQSGKARAFSFQAKIPILSFKKGFTGSGVLDQRISESDVNVKGRIRSNYKIAVPERN